MADLNQHGGRDLPEDISLLLWQAQEYHPRSSLAMARHHWRSVLRNLRLYDTAAQEPQLASIQAGILRISLRRYLHT
jgi:hypothetical protein